MDKEQQNTVLTQRILNFDAQVLWSDIKLLMMTQDLIRGKFEVAFKILKNKNAENNTITS